MVNTKISQHLVDGSKSYLFDTNVWLIIYSQGYGTRTNRRRVYTDLLKDIQARHANIYITSLILSEYINRGLRMSFNEWKARVQSLPVSGHGNYTLDFKRDYRRTPEYGKVLQEVVSQVKDILSSTVRHPDEFDTIDIDRLLETLGQTCDYNDAYLVKCCESGSLILVSDDGDVKNIPGSVCLISAR